MKIKMKIKNKISNWLEKRRYKIPLWMYWRLVKAHWISNEPLAYSNMMVISDSLMVMSYDPREAELHIRERMIEEAWQTIMKLIKHNLYLVDIQFTMHDSIGDFSKKIRCTAYFAYRPHISFSAFKNLMEDMEYPKNFLGRR